MNASIIRNWTIVKVVNSHNTYLKGYIFGDVTGEYEDGEIYISTPIIDGGGGYIITYDRVFKLED